MRAIWYFDFISPFAYLQWQKLSRTKLPVEFEWRPLLFAGLLQHLDHKGPAEIPGKREFTYRMVAWQARREGVELRFPPAHPFNPLPALRLCIAAGSSSEAVGAIFDHLWRAGLAGDTIESLHPVASRLGVHEPAVACAAPAVKQQLRANGQAALAAGVFGVPSIVAEGEVFWGNDATPLFLQWLERPNLFEDEEFRVLRHLPEAVRRV